MMLPNQVWQLTGKDQSGPNVMVLGGTHGDELTGIELVRHMLSQLGLLNQPSGAFERNDAIGNLFLGFGNPEAILRKTRGASAARKNSIGRLLRMTPWTAFGRESSLRYFGKRTFCSTSIQRAIHRRRSSASTANPQNTRNSIGKFRSITC